MKNRPTWLYLLDIIVWPLAFLIFGLAVIFRYQGNPDWNLILAYIAILRWPLIALFLIFLIRPHIASLIQRSRKLFWKDGGIELDPHEQPPTPTPDEERTLRIISDEQVSVADQPNVTVESNGANSDGAAPPSAESLLADTGIQLLFERIYRTMYGTQFEALKLLQKYPAGLNEKDLEPLLKRHREITPVPFDSVVELMGWANSYSLITYEPVVKVYALTPSGHLFLEYLSRQGPLNAKLY